MIGLEMASAYFSNDESTQEVLNILPYFSAFRTDRYIEREKTKGYLVCHSLLN